MMKKLFLPLFLSLALLCSCSQANATWQEQYDLGVKYLSEGNYEEAILAFESAIEIDPKRAEAYIGLAETYVAMDDPDRAAEILQQGVEAVGESELLTKAWSDLGLTPPENGGGNDSSPSAEGLSFAGMTPEEITAILPSLTQPDSAYHEVMDNPDGSYEQREYSKDDQIVRITGYQKDGSIRWKREVFRSYDTNLIVYYFPMYGAPEYGYQYILYDNITGRLLMNYLDIGAAFNQTDNGFTTYSYKNRQVVINMVSKNDRYTCSSTFTYEMLSTDHEALVCGYEEDPHTNSFSAIVVQENGPHTPNKGIFSAFHGDGTPYPEFDMSQYIS